MSDRIERDPRIMRGHPVIRSTRITVGNIVDEIDDGTTVEELLREYPRLDREDIEAALACMGRAEEPADPDMPARLRARIERNPKIMVGKPVIRGTRITVEHIVRELDWGATVEELLEEHPKLDREAIEAALAYAGRHLLG